MVCWTLRSPAARAVQAVTSHNFPALGVKTDLQGHTTTCLKYAILILVIFVAQQLYECLGQLNFVWNIPIHRGTKCNCPQVSSSKEKAGGTQFVLVLFYSLRSIGKCNLVSRHIPNQYGVCLFWLPYFEHIWSKKNWKIQVPQEIYKE
jgi:hypothetical protein